MIRASESRITTLAAEWWRLVDAGNTPGLSDREAEWHFEAADEIVARLIELPAADASDLAAKVLVCACEYRHGQPLPGTRACALLSSTLADARRLADPEIDLIAENAFCADDEDAPNRMPSRQLH